MSQVGADNENHIRVGKLNLVDLAGSERQTKTGAEVNTSSLASLVRFFLYLVSHSIELESA